MKQSIPSASGIEHPALPRALQAFHGQEEQGKDPVVAILGPPGCGKSDLMRDLLVRLVQPANGTSRWNRIVVDLLNVPMSTEAEMYGHVVTQMRENALVNGLNVRVKPGSSGEQMEYLLEEASIQCQGRLVFALDHLNCVPYQFAQLLSQRLRGLKESSDRAAEVGNIALVVTGTASLYKLTSSDKSAFHLAKIICLPLVHPESCKQFIRRRLEESRVKVTDDLVELLYAETHGEPSFLNPVLDRVIGGSSMKAVKKSIEKVDHSEVPHLRFMALHLHQNDSLREIVTNLIAGRRTPRRSTVPDIDEHQLTGVVVFDGGPRAESYSFRNGIVSRFISNLIRGPLPTFIQDLEESQEQIRRAPDGRSCAAPLLRAWQLLTNHSTPKFHVVFLSSTGKRVYFNLPGAADPTASDDASVTLSVRTRTYAFAVEGDTISLAIPLSKRDATCWLVCTSERSRQPFSEFFFQLWFDFLSTVADTLVARAVESILEQNLATRLNVASTAAPHSERPVSWLILTDDNALIVRPPGTHCFRGRLDPRWLEWANKSDFLKNDVSKEDFDKAIDETGYKVRSAIDTIPGLNEKLQEDPSLYDLTIASDLQGLKIPLELFSVDKTPLCLSTGVARQIFGHIPPKELRKSFSHLISQLRDSREQLRVLLFGVDPSGMLPVEKEIVLVKGSIEKGCVSAGMATPIIHEVESPDASRAALRERLQDCRPYHIFHFCGHGLHKHIRLNERGMPDDLSSSLLKEWLRGAGISLCFMSACHTGKITGEGILTSFGMLEDLLVAGIPNIVSFRWAVSAASSAVLAAKFYEKAFALETTLVTAMWQARLASRAADDLSDAWASSLLITQCPG